MTKLPGLLFTAAKSNLCKLDRPYKLTFVASYACNSRCRICNIWQRKPENELSADEIDQFFKNNSYFRWIDVTGGEISVTKNIDRIFASIIQNSPDLYLLHFPTNGLLPEKIDSVVDKILRSKVPRVIVSISLDGPEKMHDELRGIAANWRRAVKTYQLLMARRTMRFDCYFGMTLSRYNISLIDETVHEIKRVIPEFSHDRLHLNIAHSSEVYYRNGHSEGGQSISLDDYDRYIKPALKNKGPSLKPVQIIETLYQRKIRSYLKTGRHPIRCRSLEASCFLDSQGFVYPCAFFNEKLGNVRDNDYKLLPILNSSKSEKLKKTILSKKCPNCWTPCEAYQSILGNLLNKELYFD